MDWNDRSLQMSPDRIPSEMVEHAPYGKRNVDRRAAMVKFRIDRNVLTRKDKRRRQTISSQCVSMDNLKASHSTLYESIKIVGHNVYVRFVYDCLNFFVISLK